MRSRAALLASLVLGARPFRRSSRGGPAVPHAVAGGVPRRRARLDQHRSARDPAAGAPRRTSGRDRGAVPVVGRAASRRRRLGDRHRQRRTGAQIDASGKVETLFTTEEPEVFAVWADAKGTVYAGSSPDGKVYRHAGGKTACSTIPMRPTSGKSRATARAGSWSRPEPRASCSKSRATVPARSSMTATTRICARSACSATARS